jgi:short-subunit dehydrogenase
LFLPAMLTRKSGKILNLASIASFFPGPNMAVYYATKAFVLSFSEALSSELEGTGVSVTCLCPGPTASNFQAAAGMEDSKIIKGKKLPTSKEVAEYGYAELMKGTVVAIHGFMNKMMVFSQRLTPRFVVRKMVKYLQAK